MKVSHTTLKVCVHIHQQYPLKTSMVYLFLIGYILANDHGFLFFFNKTRYRYINLMLQDNKYCKDS